MAVSQAIPITRHPYADGSYKKMLIDGKWVDAASGKKSRPITPRPASCSQRWPRAMPRTSTARWRQPAAPSKVPGARSSRLSGRNLLLKLADLVEKNFEELSQLDTLDMARRSAAPAQQAARARHAALLRGPGDRAAWRDHRKLAARRDLLLHAEGAGWRRRRDHSLERFRSAPASGRSARRLRPAAP